MARRSESLRRFNYSPGEDDSRWLNSLEKREEEEVEEEEEEDARGWEVEEGWAHTREETMGRGREVVYTMMMMVCVFVARGLGSVAAGYPRSGGRLSCG